MSQIIVPEAAGALRGDEGVSGASDAVRAGLGRARSLARAWALGTEHSERVDQAALFARAALGRFAAAARPMTRLSPSAECPRGTLDAAGLAMAEAIGAEAAKLPLLEALHVLTGLYPSLLPADARGSLGAFYSPPALVERMLDLATEEGADWANVRVLDPASGGGIFLLHAAKRMRAAMAGGDPRFLLAQFGQRLKGLELDPHAASLSQNALELFLGDLACEAGRAVPLLVNVGDTLETMPEEKYDLVIGNPPYGRVALTSEQRSRFARSLYGHANLYGVFTDVAVRWTRPGGLIAFLTPASFLGGQYYLQLRKLLAREAPPVAIDFVHARKGVFEDVLQETLLALYRKGGCAAPIQVHYVEVLSEHEASLTTNGKVSLPKIEGAPWLAPRDAGHSKLIAAATTMSGRLAEWGYRVSTGPLVWNRFKRQLRTRRRGSHPLIWAECVTSDGRFMFRAERKGHAPYFKLGPADGWLLVTRPCVLVQRTTAKEQARRLIAAELPSGFVETNGGVVIENHLNMVRAEGRPLVSPATVAAVLNSDIIDQLFRCISGSVAVSAFELESLPLPDAAAMQSIEELVARGAPRRDIERALNKLYAGPPR